MKTIWKYRVAVSGQPTSILLKKDAEILKVGVSGDDVVFWAEHTGSVTERTFYVFGTGHLIPDYLTWRGTVEAGSFVWHLYEAPIN